MKAICCLAGLAAVTGALQTVKQSNPAVVEAPIRRKPFHPDPVGRDRMRRRDGTVQLSLDNDVTLYLADVSLGTPEQKLQLHIDTGSSDLWVNTPSSAICQQYARICAEDGTYSANKSSSYKYLNSDFNITYVDGSQALGDYVTDTIRIGDYALTGFQFGIGYTSTSQEGIMGIGYAINEVAVNNANDETYPNLPVALRNAGFVNSVAYSLWLNDLDSNTGSILFGGVDTAKYHAPLSTLPIIKTYGYYAEFVIALTALGQNGNQGSIADNVAIPVLLDSGSSLTYLPDNIVNNMLTYFGAQYDSDLGAAVVSCSLASQNGSIDFTFSSTSATISVPYDELVLVGGTNSRGQEYCIFGIAPAGNSNPVLGDTFLRSAYVVYDLQGNTISLAQTRYNATGSSIEEISNSTSTTRVPGATTVANAVTSVSGVGSGVIGRIGHSSDTGAAAALAPPRAMYGVAAAALTFGAILAA